MLGLRRNLAPAEMPKGWKMPNPDTTPEPGRLPFEFTGEGSEYFRIAVVNLLLSIVTLGIYSAWARVRTLNYFYGNTRVAGSTFSFLASPIAILKGRLLVVGVLVGFTVLGNLVSPWFLAAFVVVLIAGLPWLVVRAARFRAVNTAWRNVRFNFHGTMGGAARAFLLWPIVALLTLWILHPLELRAQRKYLISGHGYGTSRFTFDAEPGPFFGAFFGSVGIAIVAFVAALLVLAAVSLVMVAIFIGSGGEDGLLGGSSDPGPFTTVIGQVVGIGSVAFSALAAQSWFQSRMFNITYRASRLGKHGFEANMTAPGFFRIASVNLVLIVLTLGLFFPFAQVRLARYKAECLALCPLGSLDDFVADETARAGAFGDEAAAALDLNLGF